MERSKPTRKASFPASPIGFRPYPRVQCENLPNSTGRNKWALHRNAEGIWEIRVKRSAKDNAHDWMRHASGEYIAAFAKFVAAMRKLSSPLPLRIANALLDALHHHPPNATHRSAIARTDVCQTAPELTPGIPIAHPHHFSWSRPFVISCFPSSITSKPTPTTPPLDRLRQRPRMTVRGVRLPCRGQCKKPHVSTPRKEHSPADRSNGRPPRVHPRQAKTRPSAFTRAECTK